LKTGIALALPPAATAAPGDTEIQILGLNDFHGRIDANGQDAGAAVVAGAVAQLRSDNPNTVFAGAGDFIGASTFQSFIAQDKPTIDALKDASLQVSSVGNHEFDQGWDDLANRVIPSADWKYLGANVKKLGGGDALTPTWETTVGGVKVGFVGAVTEHLSELVSPAGIATLKITDIAQAVNAGAAALKADGAKIVVLLVHEGYATTDCSGLTDANSDFGKVVGALSGNIDAVISGHTHLEYNCAVPLAERNKTANPTRDLPVLQGGMYGHNLDQLVFSVDGTGAITDISHTLLPLTSKDADGNWQPNYTADPTVAAVVAAADADAKVKGAVPLGKVAGPLDRAKTNNGDENRGGESDLGNLVAEAQRWVTVPSTGASAQIAFMNPGGLRADIEGNNAKGYPADVTYEQAATVQPFANTLVNMTLTGAQIKTVLEQQWQPEGASRPMLRLGISKGFVYTYNPDASRDQHITGMWLNGEPVTASGTYNVTVNSFLAAGGDNFLELANGTNKSDSGITDLEGMVEFLAAMTKAGPLAIDSSQRSVGVVFPAGAKASYAPGDTVTFSLSSLVFPSPAGSTKPMDTSVTVSLGGRLLGTFPVGTLASADKFDETGTAKISVVLPSDAPAGPADLVVAGATTGTSVPVAITVEAALAVTGVDVLEPAAVAVLLLLLGSALVVVARRRVAPRLSETAE
jgi:5'-nucleotidase